MIDLTKEEAKCLFDNCSGYCDNCKYHYYDGEACVYFYSEPILRCRLDDILAEAEE